MTVSGVKLTVRHAVSTTAIAFAVRCSVSNWNLMVERLVDDSVLLALEVLARLVFLAETQSAHGEFAGSNGLFDLEHDLAHVNERGLEQKAREESEEVAGHGVTHEDEDL